MAFSLPTSSFNFDTSLSASEKIDAAEYFVGNNASDITAWDKAGNLPISIEEAFGPNAPDLGAALGLDYTQFLGGITATGWTFITAPEDVSWDVSNAASRVDMFGTNNPPVVAGSRGMRDLTLGNALVEGFMRGVTIEGKVQALENLMNYGFNFSDGFVSVPVYQVWAQDKQYGGPQGYFIIKDVKVKEVMRDTAGWATRAYVDISLMQVPAYQVNSGRDQASATTSGAKSALISAANARNAQQQANQNLTGPGGTPATSPNAKPSSGPTPGDAKPAKPEDPVESAPLERKFPLF
jgi:hypothetical protein